MARRPEEAFWKRRQITGKYQTGKMLLRMINDVNSEKEKDFE